MKIPNWTLEKTSEIIRSAEFKKDWIWLQGKIVFPMMSPAETFKVRLQEKNEISLTKEYLNDKSIALQCYSLEILMIQDQKLAIEILQEKMNEHNGKKANYSVGDVGYSITVNDYLFTATNKYLTEDQMKKVQEKYGPFKIVSLTP